MAGATSLARSMLARRGALSQPLLRMVHESRVPPELPATYAGRPFAYIEEKLGWVPWKGEGDHLPGQWEIIEGVRISIRKQEERLALMRGELAPGDAQYYVQDEIIQTRFHVSSGHGPGKTKMVAGIHSWFLDCYQSIIYSYAPTLDQLTYLLWKEIKSDREGKGLPGRVLETNEIKISPRHFSAGRAANRNASGGTAKFQGQHGPYLMFILDEAEEIPQEVFDGIDAMSTGGVVIVLEVGNPQTRTSPFFQQTARADTRTYVMSSLNHPNVVTGTEVIPHAVRRDAVEGWISRLCTVVPEHDADRFTFELPWDALLGDPNDKNAPPVRYPAGTVFQPESEFLWRIMGIAPPEAADKTLIPLGRYQRAVEAGRSLPAGPLVPTLAGELEARIGVDAARFGADFGNVYVCQGQRVWRAARMQGQETTVYARRVRETILALIRVGVKRISVRADDGGGYGSWTDQLRIDGDLRRAIREAKARVVFHRVLFNARPDDMEKFADVITEAYAHAGERLRGLAVVTHTRELERDLTARQYAWTTIGAREVKELEPKEKFKKREKHSPDDGDGFCLCVAPEFVFAQPAPAQGGESVVNFDL
ncbi:MAG TPA: hypothetical protein VFR37_25315 [Longimicrobium sp.]|nr:hypothetical protein [Longimicrobium sp.]